MRSVVDEEIPLQLIYHVNEREKRERQNKRQSGTDILWCIAKYIFTVFSFTVVVSDIIYLLLL